MRKTFSNFVVVNSNKPAFCAAKRVAESPGEELFNPLFIWGKPGVGKTHLLTAIANEVKTTHPNYNIVLVTGEHFIEEVISAIRYGRAKELQAKYRSVDMLLVDDIQFIAGKNTTQIELLNTFDSIINAGGQIIVTSDRSLDSIPNLSERLSSRLFGSLSVEIPPPSFDELLEIASGRADEFSMHFSLDQLHKAATYAEGDVRRLEGFFKSLSHNISMEE